ncbi:MAG: TetR family transcriptional regulator [Dehalococcoidia bacterium]|nr:TetR family transcriptional regulator [Dehalococcoidia bacterium]
MATDTRERMLETTARLVARQGYQGSSLGDILDACGAPRGSLYHHFPGGKAQLVLEATRLSVHRIDAAIEEILEASGDPVEAVRTYVGASAEELRESGYTFGCPVGPVVLDDPEADSPIAAFCRETFDGWERMFADHFAGSGIPAGRARSLATVIVASVEGALVMARARRDTTPLDAVAEELVRLIRGAIEEGAARAVRGSGRAPRRR